MCHQVGMQNEGTYWLDYYREVHQRGQSWLDYSNAAVQMQSLALGLEALGNVAGTDCL